MRYGRQKRFVGKGRYSDTDLIKYARVDRAEEIEYREKSDFPAKEVLSPITQSLFYFHRGMNSLKARPVPRSCLYSCGPAISTHSITRKRSTWTNGGYEDIYYKRMNER